MGSGSVGQYRAAPGKLGISPGSKCLLPGGTGRKTFAHQAVPVCNSKCWARPTSAVQCSYNPDSKQVWVAPEHPYS